MDERRLHRWATPLPGAAAASFIVPLYALFHARSVEEFRGRFWGLESCLRTAAMCAGYFVAGTLAQRLPLGLVFAGTSVVLAFLGVMVLRIRAAERAAGRRSHRQDDRRMTDGLTAGMLTAPPGSSPLTDQLSSRGCAERRNGDPRGKKKLALWKKTG